MASTIKIKNSSTAGAVPGSGDLVQGELAVNVTDKKIYTKNASGTVVNLGTTPSITDNGNAEAIVIDSSENVGLGVTPSAWGGSFKALEFGGGNSFYSAGDRAALSANAYYNGSAWTYKATGGASRYEMVNNQAAWYYAASGTAGNTITFTQAMTLDASGNLGVGTTSPSQKLDVVGSGAAIAMRVATTSGNAAFVETSASTGSVVARLQSNVDGAWSGTLTNHAYFFQTNGSERARIDSSGNLLVGTTSNTYNGRAAFSKTGTNPNLVVTGDYNTPLISFNGGPYMRSDGSYFILTTTAASGDRSIYMTAQTAGVYLSAGATSWTASSDERLKTDLVPISNAAEKVVSLRAVTGRYITDNEDKRRAFLIAQDVQAVLPEAVTVSEQKDHEGELGVQYTDVIPLLVAAIKEQQTIIESLTQRITALEA